MKLRRVKRNGVACVQALSMGGWKRLNRLKNMVDCDLFGVLQLDADVLSQLQLELDSLEHVEDDTAGVRILLPFEPASFRDFMLYEKHVVDASRGYARRFLPGVFPVTQFIEKLTRRPFKKFRPHPLWYSQPIYYFGNHLNFGVSGDDVAWPRYSDALDYELELGAVITKPLFNATAEEALCAIGGFVVLNDLSSRDVQKNEMDSGLGPQKAKHFASTISSVVATADEVLPHIHDLNASVLINGREVSKCHSSGMHFSLGEAIAFASKEEHLHPGEFFGTGTIPGGSGMENGHWLKQGDTITLTIDRIGELTNKILVKQCKSEKA